MAIQELNPYLMFNGDAEKAIALYQRALDAKLDGEIMRFGDVEGTPADAPYRNWVMHSMLRVGGGVIMVSDTMPSDPISTGSNVQVCLNFTDVGYQAKCFEALAQGGTVTMPLEDTFWGARFGTLTDAFGVRWMFNCDLKKG